MTQLHQACCAQKADNSLDGNRYRFREMDGVEPGDCGLLIVIGPQSQCQAEVGGTRYVGGKQCSHKGNWRLRVGGGEGDLVMCAGHFERHLKGDVLWVYLPPL